MERGEKQNFHSEWFFIDCGSKIFRTNLRRVLSGLNQALGFALHGKFWISYRFFCWFFT